MTFATINIPPGLERNATPYDTPERWWDMSLVRFVSGSLRPIGGWTRSTSSPLDTRPRGMFVYRDNSGGRRVLVGTDYKFYADISGTFTDLTPQVSPAFAGLGSIGVNGGYGTFDYGEEDYGVGRSLPSPIFSPSAFWSFTNWGEDVIFTNNADGRLYYYDTSTPSTRPTLITGATVPTTNTAVIVTNERHVMCVGVGGNIRRVGWSSRESTTDWDFASTTNTAGFVDLDARTPLTRPIKVREGILIFSQSEVYLARYVGLPFIYGIDRVSDTSPITPMSIAPYNGKAMWLAKDGFWKYDGGYVTPVPCPIFNDIKNTLDQTYGPFRSHAVHNGAFPEIWFFFPSTNSLPAGSIGRGECDRYVIYNYIEDWWAWGSLGRSAAASAEAYKSPYMGGIDGHVYEHEVGWTNAGTSRVNSVWAETGVIPFTNGDKGVAINQILPSTGYGTSSLNLRFYTKQAPEGSETTWGPFTPRANGYTDCRVNGRDVRIRLTATQDSEWSVGKFRVNIQPGDGR